MKTLREMLEFASTTNAAVSANGNLLQKDEVQVEELDTLLLPYMTASKLTAVALGKIYKVTQLDSARKHWYVGLYCMGKDQFYVDCGNTYVTGRRAQAQADSLLADSINSTRNAFGLSDAKVEELKDELKASFKTIEADHAGCTFFVKLTSSNETMGCEHTDAVMSHVRLEEVLTSLETEFMTRVEVADPSAKLESNLFFKILDEHRGLGINTIFQGEPGCGKTTQTYAWMTRRGMKTYVIGGDGGVEPSDIKGMLIPDGKGGAVYKPGTLARALLDAQRGEEVGLLIDELYRFDDNTRATMLKVFTPLDGCYTLETDRIVGYDEDGIPLCQVIKAPVEKINVVFTTNMGTKFGVMQSSVPLNQRSKLVNVEMTETEMRNILSDICDKYQIDKKLSRNLAAFYKATKSLCKDGQLENWASIRIFARVIKLASLSTDKEVAVVTRLREEFMQFVDSDSDGEPIREQIESFNAAVDRAFKISK